MASSSGVLGKRIREGSPDEGQPPKKFHGDSTNKKLLNENATNALLKKVEELLSNYKTEALKDKEKDALKQWVRCALGLLQTYPEVGYVVEVLNNEAACGSS